MKKILLILTVSLLCLNAFSQSSWEIVSGQTEFGKLRASKMFRPAMDTLALNVADSGSLSWKGGILYKWTGYKHSAVIPSGSAVQFTKNSATLYPTNNEFIGLGTNTTAEAPIHITPSSPGLFSMMQPNNYGTSYAGGAPSYPTEQGTQNRWAWGYGRFDGVNPGPSGGRPNVVLALMYNGTIGGGRVDTSEAAWQMRWESSFIINGNSHSADFFEFHFPEVTAKNGTAYRNWSTYVNKRTGMAFIQSHNNGVAYNDTQTPDTSWLSATPGGVAQTTYDGSHQVNNSITDLVTGFQVSNQFDNGNYTIAALGASKYVALNGAQVISLSPRNNFFNNTGVRDGGFIVGQDGVFADAGSIDIYPGGAGDTAATHSDLSVRIPTSIVEKSLFHYRSGDLLVNMNRGATGFGYTTVGALPNSTAVAINSTKGALYPPRMTTTQRDALTPDEGATIYNLTLHKLQTYDGTTWQSAW